MQQPPGPAQHYQENCGPLPGNAQKGGVKIRIQERAQVRTRRSRGQAFGSLFRPRQRSPRRPLLLLRRGPQRQAPEHLQRGLAALARRRLRPCRRRIRTPRPPARGPCPYLVDVAVGAAADALNQLEVFLRFRRDRSKPGFMAGPRCPPPPFRAGEGGRSGGHTESGRRSGPPAPPAVTIARLHAAAALPSRRGRRRRLA